MSEPRLYISRAMGMKKMIGPSVDSSISRADARNILIAANANKQIKGVFLGTCLTGKTDFARFFLENEEPTSNGSLAMQICRLGGWQCN